MNVRKWANLKGLSSNAKFVLWDLMLRADNHHECWPKWGTLMEDCSLSKRAVANALSILKAVRVIVKVGDVYGVVKYRINVAKIQKELDDLSESEVQEMHGGVSQEHGGVQEMHGGVHEVHPYNNKSSTEHQQDSNKGGAHALPQDAPLKTEETVQAEGGGNMKKASTKIHVHKGKKKPPHSVLDIGREKGGITIAGRQTLIEFWKQRVADAALGGFQLDLTGMQRGQLDHLAKAFNEDWHSLQAALDVAFDDWMGFLHQIYQDTGKYPKQSTPSPGMVLFYKEQLVRHWQLIAKKKKQAVVTAVQKAKVVLPTKPESDKMEAQKVKELDEKEKADVEAILKDF